jgi:hypothetical protein
MPNPLILSIKTTFEFKYAKIARICQFKIKHEYQYGISKQSVASISTCNSCLNAVTNI